MTARAVALWRALTSAIDKYPPIRISDSGHTSQQPARHELETKDSGGWNKNWMLDGFGSHLGSPKADLRAWRTPALAVAALSRNCLFGQPVPLGAAWWSRHSAGEYGGQSSTEYGVFPAHEDTASDSIRSHHVEFTRGASTKLHSQPTCRPRAHAFQRPSRSIDCSECRSSTTNQRQTT